MEALDNWYAVGALLAVAYFAPMFLALVRGHPQAAPICVVNIFLGWTLVGYVVALAWSVSHFGPPRYRRRH